MRPAPFHPVPLDGRKAFVRDETSGLVWHRVFHRPLYADTDRSQVVYHANYLRYFELGRASLMRDMSYPYREVEESGYTYPITKLELSFHHPLHYDEPIWIQTRPRQLERVRITFDYVITHGDSGLIICKGFTIHCALSRAGRPVAVDELTVAMWRTFPK
jgi:acyl-CoA thioester hydrolase